MRTRALRSYTPATGQIPVSDHERHLCQLQRLVIQCPDNDTVRRRYHELLAGPVPTERRTELRRVITAQIDGIHAFENRWNIRLARWVRRWAIWLELRF